MKNGFYQIEVTEADIHKTAFVCPSGHYKFTRMAFGFITTPRTFQRTVSNMFSDDQRDLLFLDDILLHDQNEIEHENNLKKAFKKINENNIQLNISKCEFYKSSVKYLGRIISHNKVQADLEELKVKIPKLMPITFRELRKLLGFVNWFRPYVLAYLKVQHH